MTLIPRLEEKTCFIACSEDKVKNGLCDCVNRMQNQALNIPNVVVPKGTLVCNYCLEKVNTLPDDFGCQSCIDNYK